MGAAENKQLVHETFAALSTGDSDKFFGNLSDDVCWTIIGTTKYSHTYTGKADIVARLFTPLTEQLEGFITNTVLNTIADGDFVAMQTQGKSQTKTSKPYNNTYCLIIQLQDSKIQKITEYLDTELVTAAFE